jgi:putative hemolysin
VLTASASTDRPAVHKTFAAITAALALSNCVVKQGKEKREESGGGGECDSCNCE